MQYRPDIDGLRALAVLPVVLYHAGVPGPSGGFVGVDIFFVISGFLITKIVARELEEKRFSLIHFYERRARRILPALAAVIAATLIAGWFILLPREFEDLGQSTVATAFFASNIYFAITLDYFAAAADFAPLLHTWSLAVEEQFYLFFPPLLALLFSWRSRRFALWAVAGLSAVSLAAAIIVMPSKAQWVFYIIVFRAWELGAGAMLALAALAPPRNRAIREALGVAGLASIVLAIFAYDKDTDFPGLAALLPVIGAALLIHIGGAGGGSVVTRLLSLRFMVWTGLISYSLYLWHWPILAYIRVYLGSTEIPLAIGLAASALSVMLAWLSWRYVEQPFRHGPPKGPGRTRIFALSGIALGGMIGVGLALHLTGGLPQRLNAETVRIAHTADDRDPRHFRCMNKTPEKGLCLIGKRPNAQRHRDFLLWGDSHASANLPGIDRAGTIEGITGLSATHPGCVPLIGIARIPDFNDCAGSNEAVWSFLQSRDDLELVILSARWALAAEGTRYLVEQQRELQLVALNQAGQPIPSTNGQTDNAAVFENALRQTVAAIRATGRDVVLLGPTPEVPWNVPGELARAQMLGNTGRDTMPAALHQTRAGRTERILRKIAGEDAGVRYLPLADLLCDETRCRLTDDSGLPLYIDDDHLTNTAALALLPPRLAQIWARE